MGRFFIGTSGFVYPHWRGILYPPGLPASRWLKHYARTFSTVELNVTFYRLPSLTSVQQWRAASPADFLFACKGSRFLTHMKRLRDPEGGLERFFGRVGQLREKLGPVLWQLPPQMDRPDLARLRQFLTHLPTFTRHAVEFRSEGWYTEEVCALLDSYQVAFCEHDLVERPPPRHTGGFRYLRFHGAGAKYAGRYGRRALRPVARDLLASRAGDAFVYFNNDVEGHAVRDAIELMDLVGQPGSGAYDVRGSNVHPPEPPGATAPQGGHDRHPA